MCIYSFDINNIYENMSSTENIPEIVGKKGNSSCKYKSKIWNKV